MEMLKIEGLGRLVGPRAIKPVGLAEMLRYLRFPPFETKRKTYVFSPFSPFFAKRYYDGSKIHPDLIRNQDFRIIYSDKNQGAIYDIHGCRVVFSSRPWDSEFDPLRIIINGEERNIQRVKELLEKIVGADKFPHAKLILIGVED